MAAWENFPHKVAAKEGNAMKTLQTQLKQFSKERTRRKKLLYVVSMLSVTVALCVFWKLKITGITMAEDAFCGKEAHTHTEACMEKVLVCGLEESAELTDGSSETPGSAEQGSKEGGGVPEQETEADSESVDAQEQYIDISDGSEYEEVAGAAEAADGEADFCDSGQGNDEGSQESETESADTQVQHVHGPDCYETVYTCGLEEHTHTALCFSDTGDIEDPSQWTADFPTLSGEWPSDAAAIAESQIGYTEKENNFSLAEDGETRKGYTRYADWYFGETNRYADWNAVFAAFCLRYAGVPEEAVPINSGADAWLVQLDQQGLFRDLAEEIPQRGDLLFVDSDGNGAADRVGIVVYADGNVVQTVEGDCADAVAQTSYAPSDSALLGYGSVNQAYDSYFGIEDVEEAEDADSAEISEEEEKVSSEAEEDADSAAVVESEDVSLDVMLADEGSAAPDYIGTINTANQWQIVAGQYEGNANSNKKSYDTDGDKCADILLQKNVVPTETENEFLVYLGVTKQMSWDDLLAQSQMGLTTQGKWSDSDVGSLVGLNQIGGNKSNVLQPGYSSGGRNYEATVYLTRGGTTIHTYVGWYNGTTPNASNCTGYIILKGVDSKAIIASVSVNLHQDGSGSGGTLSYTIDLDKMSSNGIFYAVEEISLDSVTDVLGEEMVYEDVVNVDGTVSYAKADNTLTWNIKENESVTGINYLDPVTGYIENVAQLVYRVRLDVTRDGFQSCAGNMNSSVGDKESCAVNQSATLNYRFGTEAHAQNFSVPYVRGLLYDITFEKKGDDGKYLSGAVFGLYEADGVTPVYQNNEPYTITTDKNVAENAFLNLPYGTYVVRETKAPRRYSAPETAEWKITLCYTTNSSQLEQDTGGNAQNMRYTGNDSNGVWTVINKKNPFTYNILVIKQDEEGNYIADVPFSLTPDADGVWQECRTDENGQYLFNAEFGLNVSFELTETRTPDGYFSLPGSIRFKVVEDEDTGEHSAILLNADQLGSLVSLKLIEDEESGENQLQITIINETGCVLPETGGPGISFYTLSGALLMMASVLMYRYRLRRKCERRSKM